MAAQFWSGIRSGAEQLYRLSIVFAVELRPRIVNELFLREMSPTQFGEEFGGGTISRLDSNFKVLAKHGWLKFIRSRTGGSRRGGIEHFYRATEPAGFSSDAWSMLPYSVRVSVSWTTLRQFAAQVRDAIAARTFDARPDRRSDCSTIQVDREGWDGVIAAVDRLFGVLYEEQAEARVRAFHSGAELAPATVLLAAFESPAPGAERAPRGLIEYRDPLALFAVRTSKVLAHEMCRGIVAAANLQEVSATGFHREFGGDKDSIFRRFKLMETNGWLKKTEEIGGGRRRGGTEKFFRATVPAILGEDPWANVPESIRDEPSWKVFEQISERIIEAMRMGTFDIREDRYFTWSLLRLDRQGWANVIAAIDELDAFIRDEQAQAKVRMKESGEKQTLMTVATAAFESPLNPAKEP
ncbi:MAG: hypothetical protein WD404_09400 [Solirubrobacterales bacterium]